MGNQTTEVFFKSHWNVCKFLFQQRNSIRNTVLQIQVYPKKSFLELPLSLMEHFLSCLNHQKSNLLCSKRWEKFWLLGRMSSKVRNIFRINRKSLFATLCGFETPGALFLGYTWIWSTVDRNTLQCCTNSQVSVSSS